MLPRNQTRDLLEFRNKFHLCSVGQGVDTILETLALVVRHGTATANATVLPGTVGVFATMALELETNTFVHVLRREEVSELWGLGNLLERPDSILAFFLSSSVASFSVAFALSFS